MTIRQLRQLIPNLRDNDRDVIRPLLKHLSPVSTALLGMFQESWHKHHSQGKTFDDFVVAQNIIIDECINQEESEHGTEIRRYFDLPPITEDTQI